MQETMTIGQLAARFGLATHVLRHWEAVGLLAPAARVSGRRRYSREHVARVAMILRGKDAGFSLDQLRAVFEAEEPKARRAVVERHRADLEQHIARLQAARRLVDHILNCPAADFTHCPNFQKMVDVLSSPDTHGVDGLGSTERGDVEERRRRAVQFARDNGTIARRQYVALSGVSPRTAANDLSELVRERVLEPAGGHGWRTAYRAHSSVGQHT